MSLESLILRAKYFYFINYCNLKSEYLFRYLKSNQFCQEYQYDQLKIFQLQKSNDIEALEHDLSLNLHLYLNISIKVSIN